MRSKMMVLFACLLFYTLPLFAQTHASVPLDNQVYYILEQAALKGLCAPMSGIRPYTQNVVLKAINEILNTESSNKIKNTEREILRQYHARFSKPKPGLDWQRGAAYGETALVKSDFIVSGNLGVSADIEGSFGFYHKKYFGHELWAKVYLNGDLGRNVSYEMSSEGGLMYAPRNYLGLYNTYYEGFQDDGEYQNRVIKIYSEPLTHFPYTYKKRWDGSIFFLDDLTGFETWPDEVSGGYNLMSGLTASFLDNKFIMRLGRFPREWGGSVPLGSSLHLNGMARPFLGVEAEFNPLSWFGIAAMTGVLEYYNLDGIKDSAITNQNVYSIAMLQFRYKNYLFVDIGESVIWPKRFELGYGSPVTNSFFYQNNIGDFDNMALMGNVKVQYPGFGYAWFSLFMDEMQITRTFYELDRTMYAAQAGIGFTLPFLSFTSLKLSYTVNNPYNYTHNRNDMPWYGDLTMETAYINNGVSLGHYLPPNSDEILVEFKTMPAKSLTTLFKYQLIRHGADFGPHAVDGSNLYSELDPHNRHGANPILKRYFLMDGAYQWNHIVKLCNEWMVPKIPVALFTEAGVSISYFTDIEPGKANSGKPYPYSRIDTTDYRQSTGFIMKIGIRVFP
jgi:hypothetical protein